MDNNEKEFLYEFQLSQDDVSKSGIEIKELINIESDFNNYKIELELPKEFLSKILLGLEGVHSVSSRLKDSKRLLPKIIKKRIENSNITYENYKVKITDLIATRALHLLKEDWLIIHNGIINNYDLLEKPKAYIRKGDDVKIFENQKVDIIDHENYYRSVHYLVKIPTGKKEYIGEIQVRTIFEEAWGELDHMLKYKNPRVDDSIIELLKILNRICGSANEMCSFIYTLNNKLERNK